MRIGVIRNDLPGPVLLSDLEPVSRYNPPTDPRGQEIYISRPTTGEVEAALASPTSGAGAVLNGGSITGSLPLTIDGTNDTLKLRIAAAAAFGTVVLAHAAYASLTTLVTALNVALSGTGITARINVAATGIALEANLKGVTSYVESDTVAHGSTGNTALGLTDGSVRTMVPAATIITNTLPVGGPLDVSTATIKAAGTSTASASLNLIPDSRGTVAAIAQAIAPKLYESTTAIDSFLVGDISELLNAGFNPDSRRSPALTPGAAITVVQDDGVSLFASTLPVLTTALHNTPNPGDVTLSGTGLGSLERQETVVHFSGNFAQTIVQSVIEKAGGSVADTAIVIPSSVITVGSAVATLTSAQVKVRQRVSAKVALT